MVTRHHRWGFPCSDDLRLHTCRRHYPGGTVGCPCRFFPNDGGLPRYQGESAPALRVSRPAQRSLTFRPACWLDHPRRSVSSETPTISLPPSPPRLLPAGATRRRVGLSPTEDRRLFTAYPINHDMINWGLPMMSFSNTDGTHRAAGGFHGAQMLLPAQKENPPTTSWRRLWYFELAPS